MSSSNMNIDMVYDIILLWYCNSTSNNTDNNNIVIALVITITL